MIPDLSFKIKTPFKNRFNTYKTYKLAMKVSVIKFYLGHYLIIELPIISV